MLQTKVILMLDDPDTRQYKTSYTQIQISIKTLLLKHPHPVGENDFLLGELLVEGVLGQSHHLDTPTTRLKRESPA
jgi:hypothetical protein